MPSFHICKAVFGGLLLACRLYVCHPYFGQLLAYFSSSLILVSVGLSNNFYSIILGHIFLPFNMFG